MGTHVSVIFIDGIWVTYTYFSYLLHHLLFRIVETQTRNEDSDQFIWWMYFYLALYQGKALWFLKQVRINQWIQDHTFAIFLYLKKFKMYCSHYTYSASGI